MTVWDWWTKSKLRVQEYGIRGARISVTEGCIDLARRIGRRIPFGTNVFSLDWDVLILLDGCRVDSLSDVIEDVDIDCREGSIWSIGSQSAEWMHNTFPPVSNELLQQTAYITANPYADNEYNTHLGLFDHVITYAWDEELETVPPRSVTDRAIDVVRNSSFDRYIIHYMQPHSPFIAPDAPWAGRGKVGEKNPTPLNRDSWFNALKYGELSRDVVWESYMENLRYVLEDVEFLLHNIDTETAVISADHGNAFGEYLTYGHPSGLLHPKVRKVPWFVTSGTNRGSYEPETVPENTVDYEREEMLEALGYV